MEIMSKHQAAGTERKTYTCLTRDSEWNSQLLLWVTEVTGKDVLSASANSPDGGLLHCRGNRAEIYSKQCSGGLGTWKGERPFPYLHSEIQRVQVSVTVRWCSLPCWSECLAPSQCFISIS